MTQLGHSRVISSLILSKIVVLALPIANKIIHLGHQVILMMPRLLVIWEPLFAASFRCFSFWINKVILTIADFRLVLTGSMSVAFRTPLEVIFLLVFVLLLRARLGVILGTTVSIFLLNLCD